jgi:hypothetical protein
MRPALALCLTRWKRLPPLARELTLVLLIKAALLGLLWWTFFSAPVAHRMSAHPDVVAARLLSAPPLPEHAHAER